MGYRTDKSERVAKITALHNRIMRGNAWKQACQLGSEQSSWVRNSAAIECWS